MDDLGYSVDLMFVLWIFFHLHMFLNMLSTPSMMTTHIPLYIQITIRYILKIYILYKNLYFCFNIKTFIQLPGQSSISHFCVTVRFPIQSLPPCKASCETFRFKVFTPDPHVTEHSARDQSIGDNSQSTYKIKFEKL